jgi:hypothetical protein
MEPKNHEDFADKVLDVALKHYSEAEAPGAGLEARVLARIRAERERRATREWSWWPAVAGSVALLTITSAILLHRRPTAEPIIAASSIAMPVILPSSHDESKIAAFPVRPPRLMHAAGQVRRKRSAETERRAPRLEQFPSVRPLSRDEQLLLAYVKDTPPEQLALAATKTAKNADDLQITDLEIPPLEVGNLSP